MSIKMKKRLTLILILALVLSTFTFAFADNENFSSFEELVIEIPLNELTVGDTYYFDSFIINEDGMQKSTENDVIQTRGFSMVNCWVRLNASSGEYIILGIGADLVQGDKLSRYTGTCTVKTTTGTTLSYANFSQYAPSGAVQLVNEYSYWAGSEKKIKVYLTNQFVTNIMGDKGSVPNITSATWTRP
jgi:hypothetical protein